MCAKETTGPLAGTQLVYSPRRLTRTDGAVHAEVSPLKQNFSGSTVTLQL